VGRRLSSFKQRSIDSFAESDKEEIESLFWEFENVLGHVGQPRLYISSRQTSSHFGTVRSPTRMDLRSARDATGGRYLTFVGYCQEQCRYLESAGCSSSLKRLDEWNYVKFKKGPII
jgi:hypothetical protein